MLIGTAMQRADMIVAERNHQAKQAREQGQAIEQNKVEMKELAQLPELNSDRSRKSEVSGLECKINIT